MDISNEQLLRSNTPVQRLTLYAILLLSTFLNLYRLDRVGFNGFGNPYYAAGIKSMLLSWHNFFYLAFDPPASS